MGLTFAYNGLATKVQFSTARAGKNVVWKRSKRLITGSIVTSSSQCVVAVVAGAEATQLDTQQE
jgi:helicase required for RNAi-mediated heterochromatin assembly 1